MSTPAAGPLGEQWQLPWVRGSDDVARWSAALTHTRALKQALSRLAIDVLTDAPVGRRRASSRRAIASAQALGTVARRLRCQGQIDAPHLEVELMNLCEAAAAVGSAASAGAVPLESLRLSYRALREELSLYLPTEMVAEGVPVFSSVTP